MAIGPALLALVALPVLAHEGDATLELDPPVVAPGGGVLIVGRGLEPSTKLRLTLEGLDQRVALGDVDVDRAGSVEEVIAVPADLAPAVYGLKLSEGEVLVVSNVLQIDPAAGPGRVVDRGPNAVLVLVGAVVAAIALLLGIRLVSRNRRRTPAIRPSPTV